MVCSGRVPRGGSLRGPAEIIHMRFRILSAIAHRNNEMIDRVIPLRVPNGNHLAFPKNFHVGDTSLSQNLKRGQVHILPRQLPVGESMLTFRLQYLADLLALLQLRVFTQLHHDNRSIAG